MVKRQDESDQFQALLEMHDKDRRRNLDNLTLKQLEKLKVIELGLERREREAKPNIYDRSIG